MNDVNLTLNFLENRKKYCINERNYAIFFDGDSIYISKSKVYTGIGIAKYRLIISIVGRNKSKIAQTKLEIEELEKQGRLEFKLI